MAAFASRSRTGFVVKNSHVAGQEFTRKAEQMAQPPCNRKWRVRRCMTDRNGNRVKPGGVERTMMTRMAITQPVMIAICS